MSAFEKISRWRSGWDVLNALLRAVRKISDAKELPEAAQVLVARALPDVLGRVFATQPERLGSIVAELYGWCQRSQATGATEIGSALVEAVEKLAGAFPRLAPYVHALDRR